MSRDRVCVVVGFCARFCIPDTCDRFVREEDTVIVCCDMSRSEKSPFHPQKPYHSPPPYWNYLEYLSLEPHRPTIIAVWRPDRCRDISTESLCDLDIHAFCSASHQECIMENQCFWHKYFDGRIIWIFVWIPKENRYSKETCIFCHLLPLIGGARWGFGQNWLGGQ